MDVSVIIVNYNTFELTCSCITSIIKHTEGLSYEIILVDNASIECSADKFLQNFPNITLIKNPVNAGFTGGNNKGIQIAKGNVVLLLNSDVQLTENSIEKSFKVLKSEPKMGLITCMLKFPNGGVQRQCQRFPSILLSTMELFRVHKLIPQPKRGIIMENGFFDHLSSIYCDSVWGAFFMFPRSVLGDFKNNLLPGDFFMYSEDLMWCYLIHKNGHLIYYNANTSVIHHLGASSSSSVLKLKHKNEYDFIVKYYGWFYAKVLVFLRGLLYKTSSGRNYAAEISSIYFTLFFKGKLK